MEPKLRGRIRSLLVMVAFVAGAPAGADPVPAPTMLRIAPPFGAIEFGAAVAGLGDIDGDGFGDVVVGAPGSDHVYVVSGATTAILHDIASPIPGLEFGAAVSAAGDVDRDGVPDLVVGAPPAPEIVAPPCPSSAACPDAAPARGQAFVISGASGAVVRQWAANAEDLAFGRSVSGVGDLSGDGVPDVVVGAPGLAEGGDTLFAYSGADGTQLWSQVAAAVTPGSTARFGELVAPTPDESGDKVVDILVSATSAAPRGSAAPISAGPVSAGPVSAGPVSAGPVSAPVGPGQVYVLSGADGGFVRTISDPTPNDGDSFGGAAAAVGDQDGDGVVDHLIGERATNKLHLYSGKDHALVRSIAVAAGDNRGGILALAPVGDRGGDGRDDFWVGRGWVRTASLLDGTGAVLASVPGPSAEGSFGHAVAAIVNPGGGSGPDLVVGDPTEPGGGAAYLVRVGPNAAPPVAGPPAGPGAACAGPACDSPVWAHSQTPTAPRTAKAPAPRPQVAAQIVTATTTTTTAAAVTPTTIATTDPTTPPTSTAPPTKVATATATLPKPAGGASGQASLPKTGGATGSLAGLCLLGLGVVVTVFGGDPDRAGWPGAHPRTRPE